MKVALAFIVLIALAVLTWWYFPQTSTAPAVAVTSFVECETAGFPVMESYPRQCRDEEGNLFVEDVTASWTVSYTNASPDLIRNVNIGPGQTITSPLTITGEARGYYFFEASFPIVLTDWDGNIIAEGYASADGDWMTEAFVPFTATIAFETPAGPGGLNRGALILKKDNPSDLPENDAALEIPVLFE